MSAALDRLLKAVNMKPQRKVVILENGEEFEFWMTPLTLAQRSRAQKQAKSDDATDFALHLLIAKATDENGEAMFPAGEVADMRNRLPASLMDSLMLQLLTNEEVEEEDEVDPKPSRPTSKRTAS